MALSDVLPDRPLTSEEVEELQDSDAFEEVTTPETPGPMTERVTITKDGTEHMLHFNQANGWHSHEHDH
ncbi:hypothetical protein [Halovenus sp. HT40]|uniref:hypothetical protein n=1 Tax=Halovenus sp. HT40 TaxID=3126691 RepID=UPI00300EB545